MTADERRALAFIAALLLLSAAVRAMALPEPVSAPDGGGFDLEAHIAATAEAVAEAERRARPLAEGERIDPNTAVADELARLPGVGPALAGRIAAERESGGRFRTTGDLTRVSGIGPRTAERLAPFLALREGGARSGGEGGPAPADGRVDLNTADAAALAGLPGVGPVIAGRIVAYRDSAGPFPAVDSLVAVRGIGPATLERLRDRVTVR